MGQAHRHLAHSGGATGLHKQTINAIKIQLVEIAGVRWHVLGIDMHQSLAGVGCWLSFIGSTRYGINETNIATSVRFDYNNKYTCRRLNIL